MSTTATNKIVRPASPLPAGEVLITRVFDAPRERVFSAWTDPRQLVCWYAPRGCTIIFRKMDFRPGGAFLSCIRNTDSGHECWCTGEYREIAAPERIVSTLAVSDEHGNRVEPAHVGMDPDWPAETILTVTFTEVAGRTKVTLHQAVSEALAKRTGAYPSWLEMLERLGQLLSINPGRIMP